MGSGIRLGSIRGIEIRLDYSWFLIFFILSWTLGMGVFPAAYRLPQPLALALGAVASVLLFASVLVHELSHAVVARAHGTEVAGITLFLFGGVARIKGEPETPKAEFLIAAVGPLVSFLIGLFCLGIWLAIGGPQTLLASVPLQAAGALVNYLGIINIVLALFNLVPGFPLDGGRILRSALWAWTRDLVKATRWASRGGQLFGWLFIGRGLWEIVIESRFSGIWEVLIGGFLAMSARAAYQQLLLRRTLGDLSVSQVMSEDAHAVDGDMRIPEFVDRYLRPGEQQAFPVFRHGEFMGLVTAEDVARLERNLWGVTCVAALARIPEDEGVVDESQNAWAALTQMVESNRPRLLVMRDGKLEGIVSRESILKRFRSGGSRRAPAG